MAESVVFHPFSPLEYLGASVLWLLVLWFWLGLFGGFSLVVSF